MSNTTTLPNNKRLDTELEVELKHLIVNTFDLDEISVDDINRDDQIFGAGIGLDSIDALELGLALKNKYGIKIDPATTQVNEYFSSISSMADLITKWQNQ